MGLRKDNVNGEKFEKLKKNLFFLFSKKAIVIK